MSRCRTRKPSWTLCDNIQPSSEAGHTSMGKYGSTASHVRRKAQSSCDEAGFWSTKCNDRLCHPIVVFMKLDLKSHVSVYTVSLPLYPLRYTMGNYPALEARTISLTSRTNMTCSVLPSSHWLFLTLQGRMRTFCPLVKHTSN
jgi:hypothetical protein